MNQNKDSAEQSESGSAGDASYPRGATGIDETRVLDAVLRLAEIASEVGWPTVLRVIADVMSRHGRPPC